MCGALALSCIPCAYQLAGAAPASKTARQWAAPTPPVVELPQHRELKLVLVPAPMPAPGLEMLELVPGLLEPLPVMSEPEPAELESELEEQEGHLLEFPPPAQQLGRPRPVAAARQPPAAGRQPRWPWSPAAATPGLRGRRLPPSRHRYRPTGAKSEVIRAIMLEGGLHLLHGLRQSVGCLQLPTAASTCDTDGKARL